MCLIICLKKSEIKMQFSFGFQQFFIKILNLIKSYILFNFL